MNETPHTSLQNALATIFYEMIIEFEEHNPRTYIHLSWNCKSYNATHFIEYPESEYLYVNVPSGELIDFINGILPPEDEILNSTIELICFDANRKYAKGLSKYEIHKPIVEQPDVILIRYY